VWAIPNQLACAQRPLRDHPNFGGRTPLPHSARDLVIAWVDRVTSRFPSIISLLEDTQNDRYYIRGGLGLHEHGLLGYYRSRGLRVASLPCTDYQVPTAKTMERALRMFQALPKPVLLHCSAGIDRTAPVAGFICERYEI
jgi:hypothetical protein